MEPSVSSRPDKQKIIDEVWDEDRIRGFLPDPADASAHRDARALLHAYRSMREGDFRRFLVLFVDAGGDPDATDAEGRTVAECIAEHRHGAPFVDALVHSGARPPDHGYDPRMPDA